MAQTELRDHIPNRLKGRQETLPEIVTEIGDSPEAVKVMIGGLMTEDTVTQEDDLYSLSDGTVAKSALSESEWKVIRFLQTCTDRRSQFDALARVLGNDEADAAIENLIDVGILVEKAGWYRITAHSAMRIPLSKKERGDLHAAESRIDALVAEVYPKQLEVARELQRIRDNKLYRETHKRFQDYVNDRFQRTRDWAYKLIRDSEVAEGLLKETAAPNVEALLQSVTARDMPHLAKLKKEPAKMAQALQQAEEVAKTEDRERTVDDLEKAVEAMTASGMQPDDIEKKPDEATPQKLQWLRKVELVGVEYKGGEIDDLPAFFSEFAKWLRKNPTDNAFTIRVEKASDVGGL